MKKAEPEEPAGLTKCGSNNKTTGGFLRARQIRNTDEERPAHTKVGSKETITGGISLLTFVTISFKIGQRHNRKLDQENKPLAVFSSGVNGEGLRPMSRWYNRRLVWSRRLGSNQRPAVYETAALPTELRRHAGEGSNAEVGMIAAPPLAVNEAAAHFRRVSTTCASASSAGDGRQVGSC